MTLDSGGSNTEDQPRSASVEVDGTLCLVNQGKMFQLVQPDLKQNGTEEEI